MKTQEIFISVHSFQITNINYSQHSYFHFVRLTLLIHPIITQVQEWLACHSSKTPVQNQHILRTSWCTSRLIMNVPCFYGPMHTKWSVQTNVFFLFHLYKRIVQSKVKSKRISENKMLYFLLRVSVNLITKLHNIIFKLGPYFRVLINLHSFY